MCGFLKHDDIVTDLAQRLGRDCNKSERERERDLLASATVIHSPEVTRTDAGRAAADDGHVLKLRSRLSHGGDGGGNGGGNCGANCAMARVM